MAELTSKRLLEPCKPWLTAYCPTMDLVATVSEKDSVDVWRFNGQRVFGLPVDDDKTKSQSIEGVAWKRDGRMLALTLSAGSMLLIDSFTGKIVHQLLCSEQNPVSPPDWSTGRTSVDTSTHRRSEASKVCWSSHFTDQFIGQKSGSGSSLTALCDDVLSLEADASAFVPTKVDLPRALAGIDIEFSLPKLSTLPPTGAVDDVLSTRTAIDSIFHTYVAGSSQGKDIGNVVDVILTRTAPSRIHLQIFDSFEVGWVDLSQTLPRGLRILQTLGYASHPLLPDYHFVVEVESDGPVTRGSQEQDESARFLLLRVEMKFLKQASQRLPLLAAKATQLQNLLRYLEQVQIQLASEVRTAFDLPSRFLGSVNESLKERDSNSSFKTTAYHLIVTGECDPRLKEWLVDEVGERGLKRWEKAVGDCLEMIRRMTSECLLPALERCQVVLSRLDGLARFNDTATRLGLDERDIRTTRDTLDSLNVLCESTLRDVCIEIREFSAFMKWLKWEAEVEALEEGSERAEEMREALSGEGELRTVLDYIEGPMDTSRVLAYVEAYAGDATEASPSTSISNGQFHAGFRQTRRQRMGTNTMPKLGELVQRLREQTDVLFLHIAETLKKSILVSLVTDLPKLGDRLDCRMIGPDADEGGFELHIMSATNDAHPSVVHTALAVGGTVQHKTPSISTRKIQIPGIVELHDFKFLDDAGIVALASTSSDRQVLWHPIRRKTDDGDDMADAWKVKHLFVGGQMTGGMIPSRVAVRERRGQGGHAVVVSDEHRMGFAVFSLESHSSGQA